MERVDGLVESGSVDVVERVYELDSTRFEAAKERLADGLECGVGTIVCDDNRLLLLKNDWSDGWILPGGGVEPGESLHEAAAREVREEVGIDVTIEEPVCVLEQTFVHGDRQVENRFVVFAGTPETTAVTDDPGVGDENVYAPGWFDDVPEDAMEYDLLVGYLDDRKEW